MSSSRAPETSRRLSRCPRRRTRSWSRRLRPRAPGSPHRRRRHPPRPTVSGRRGREAARRRPRSAGLGRCAASIAATLSGPAPGRDRLQPTSKASARAPRAPTHRVQPGFLVSLRVSQSRPVPRPDRPPAVLRCAVVGAAAPRRPARTAERAPCPLRPTCHPESTSRGWHGPEADLLHRLRMLATFMTISAAVSPAAAATADARRLPRGIRVHCRYGEPVAIRENRVQRPRLGREGCCVTVRPSVGSARVALLCNSDNRLHPSTHSRTAEQGKS